VVAAALISQQNGTGADDRGGQEARGMGGGARSHSRRDEDGGWREKRHGGDGSALLTAWRGWGQRKVGPGSGRRPRSGEELETGVGDRPSGWAAWGGRHQPRADVLGRAARGRVR
jgi:hypothetical protein